MTMLMKHTVAVHSARFVIRRGTLGLPNITIAVKNYTTSLARLQSRSRPSGSLARMWLEIFTNCRSNACPQRCCQSALRVSPLSPQLTSTFPSHRFIQSLVISVSGTEVHEAGDTQYDPTIRHTKRMNVGVVQHVFIDRVWFKNQQRPFIQIDPIARMHCPGSVYVCNTSKRGSLVEPWDASILAISAPGVTCKEVLCPCATHAVFSALTAIDSVSEISSMGRMFHVAYGQVL
ncbi:hypothetical protein F5141DRAFT_1066577 [Pisolithus sp. B1]|nr:hypothetical protein F5141DRAFT_1066577 [Pisolithus sp. B1]